MVFGDSHHILAASLKQLATSLAKVSSKNFRNRDDVVTEVYPVANVELLERTRVVCYNYFDFVARLDEFALPPREAFFNKLEGVECLQSDYAHAQHVWVNFNCQNLKEYMALYLLSDICLLADVVQAFRKNSLDEYQMDPAFFVSAPQLAWNALLKHIDSPIPLITDPEIYLMIQPNIQGGICDASVRDASANYRLMGLHYDPRLATSYIMDVDANNLYG